MATLTVQRSTADAPHVITYAAASVGGDLIPNDGKTVLHVVNGAGAPITVTATAVKACSQGFTHNSAQSVVNGTEAVIGPFDITRFNDTAGKVAITYSSVTSITVAAVGI